jgi:hypothetical protein
MDAGWSSHAYSNGGGGGGEGKAGGQDEDEDGAGQQHPSNCGEPGPLFRAS